MASSFKSMPAETPASLSADSSTIAKEAVALEAGRARTLKRTHSDAMGSPGTPVDPYLQSIASSPKLVRLDAQPQPQQQQQQQQQTTTTTQDQAAAADAVAALLDSGGRIKEDAMHDPAGYRVLTELSADNMAPSHHVSPDDEHQEQPPQPPPDNQDATEGVQPPQQQSPHGEHEHGEHVSHEHVSHEHVSHEHVSHEHVPHEHISHAAHASHPHAAGQPVESPHYHDAHESTSPHGAADSMSMGGGVQVTESPTPMEVDGRIDPAMGGGGAGASEAFHDDKSGVSMSYPGAFQSMDGSLPSTPTRGMTYPDASLGSSAKKYKCTDCNAEFTRHHNLKSHQLTHSQDKPFKCDDCDMRFRRLHDLKRHGKLHTGEKPHICSKCNRKFARGDALVRHTKGVMGCSTARGSLGGHEDGELDGPSMLGDDTAMSGIMYPGDGGSGGEDGGGDDQRRLSLPALKTSQGPQSAAVSAQQGRAFASQSASAASGSRGPFSTSPGGVAGAPTGPSAAATNFAPTASMSDAKPPLSNGRTQQVGQVGDAASFDLLNAALADADAIARHSRPAGKQLPNVPVFGPDDARHHHQHHHHAAAAAALHAAAASPRRASTAQQQQQQSQQQHQQQLDAVVAQFEALLAAQARQFDSKIDALVETSRDQGSRLRAQDAQIQVLEHELAILRAQFAVSPHNERSDLDPSAPVSQD
jgi:DNA-directed RNA polymerase subunit RPC12/RpoP